MASWRRAPAVAGTAALLALGACTAHDEPAKVDVPATVAENGSISTGFASVVDAVTPSVVTVRTPDGLGSGVVYQPDVVVTNQHVVGTTVTVTITYADGSSSPGTVTATDPVTDLALVRTVRTGLPPAVFRTDLPRAGDTALAIGSPLGFQNSVTQGVVSALHRAVPGSGTDSRSLVDLIQTDAAISPGNSGGALLDVAGKVIGINEAYIPPSAGAESLGFAIPSATVAGIADQLLASGHAVHPYLGVSLAPLTPDIQQRLGVQADHGALVLAVDPGSPADAAGIRAGDVLTRIGSTEVHAVEDVLGALRGMKPGDRVPVVVARGQDRPQLQVTLGAQG
ncbi:trypsin-like peptidase domain-containing protein [Amycolatopsis acidiphila]|uniref:PDZ domain-containing protein n=1 Tax=Amycolatopsis acidiphila TaxID=715473 RepID=A0A558AL19_9PSEU|nr:trypsin-like peptidase domain-containing protein [Amycolatopsis acidiphila]TVT24953.1 PDZ domain-containing protein [Amycolatopsis acidiphila]UIJ57548.1 trypsin-like peptidase domain-containing protein [Amycolatopsis acidiphila]GHG89422.1 hypothetical protein GCM10017788_64150 [Amycolatopsis acidiphila]